MGLLVPIEYDQGFGVAVVMTDAERENERTRERAEATSRCLALADALDATDPQRAQRLRTVANDPQRTTAERWGTYKNDDRQPRDSQAEPTGETRTR
jgi:hypothetical protein